MPTFKTAEELVAYRCFVQRLDEDGVTTYEVVDRFRTGDRIVGSFATEAEAREILAPIRVLRAAEVKHLGSSHPLAIKAGV
jgi:hypothetical protein